MRNWCCCITVIQVKFLVYKNIQNNTYPSFFFTWNQWFVYQLLLDNFLSLQKNILLIHSYTYQFSNGFDMLITNKSRIIRILWRLGSILWTTHFPLSTKNRSHQNSSRASSLYLLIIIWVPKSCNGVGDLKIFQYDIQKYTNKLINAMNLGLIALVFG